MGKKKQAGKPCGHYCRVCGAHKANEKFSGKGHAAHVCRQCAKLPTAEKNEMLDLRRIEGMAGQYLSEGEIKWLRSKMQDARPAVQQAARELHAVRFPHYERNKAKKGLVLRSLEFYVHCGVWDEWGEETPVHMRFWLDESGVARRLDYGVPMGGAGREGSVELGAQEARRLLKQIVHELDAPFWGEDLSDDLCIDDEDHDDWDEDASTPEAPISPDAEPLWSLRMVLNKGGEHTLAFYHQVHDGPQTLFWALMELFELEEET